MLESTRLEYLTAMGVVGWVPREPLALAAFRMPPNMPEAEPETEEMAPPQPRQPAPAAVAPTAPRTASGNRPQAAVEQIRASISARNDRSSRPAPVAPVVEAAPTAPAVTDEPREPISPFYLQLWLAGPCALLVEAHEPGLESASPELALLNDILRAVELPPVSRPLADFQWPLNRNPQLDRSAPAASLALNVFMQGRLEGRQVVSIGCFGRSPQLLAGPEQAAGQGIPEGEQVLEGLAPVWFAPGLGELMAQPQRKAPLWKQLQRIMRRWQAEQ